MANANKSAIALHTEENHYKFWKYDVIHENGQYVLQCKWGRLGTDGQSKSFTFPAEYLAVGEGCKKLDEKRRKGYKVVSPAELEVAQQRGQLVGAGNKVDRLLFVKRTGPNSYESIADENANFALANPEVEPGIWIVLTRTGGKGTYQMLITHEGQFVLEGTPVLRTIMAPTGGEAIRFTKRRKLREHPEYLDGGFVAKIAPSIEKLAASLMIKDDGNA